MLLVFMIVIKELTNQILLPRTKLVADSAFSSEWRCVHANSLCFRFWQVVKAKSKTMDFWVRRRPLLSTYRKVSGCLSSL